MTPRMETWSLSTDQDIGDHIGAFFRYAQADTTFRDFHKRAVLGFQVKKPFAFTYDRLGVGAWWGDPTDMSLNEEVGVEFFYKAQISPFMELTPDIQVVLNPANSTDSTRVVFGLRLRIVL